MDIQKNWNQYREKHYEIVFMRYIAEQTPYRVIRKLGYGSYGITYLLEDRKSEKKVVMKRLRARGKKKRKIRNHFFFEIATLQHLAEESFPKVFCGGQIEDIPFYIMEYMDGQTFEELIFQENKPFTVDESLKIVEELFEIVSKIHKAGYAHRDLRIPNILSVDGKLRIIDFGLAAPLQKEDKQLWRHRHPKRLKTPQSDLYAIGHFLLFLLYSTYHPTESKERSWQEELKLPFDIENFIERLLGIKEIFQNIPEAQNKLSQIRNHSIQASRAM